MTYCVDHGRAGGKQGYARSHGILLHRKVYADKAGVALEVIKGYVVRHTCDNTRCINPQHLVLGTQADNNADRANRGRSAKRVASRQALTPGDVAAIRSRYNPRRLGKAAPDGMTQLAYDYNVDRKVIYKVIKGTYLN